ncbi:MAG TPA: hypothetical protein VGG62_02060 [Terracidiphilus sp.]|jgi:ketosteroid isomerase-like protein
MQQSNDAIEHFFRNFEANASSNDFAAQVAQFADVFMVASPQGAQAVRASDFALVLPKKKQFFDKLGCRTTAMVSLHEVPLDARFAMASTQWRLTFVPDQGEPQDVVVHSVYIVDRGVDPFKIVFYLASQDLMQILKERGILPG